MNLICENPKCAVSGVVSPGPTFDLAEDDVVICGMCNEPTGETEAEPWTDDEIRAHLQKVKTDANPAN